MTKRRSLTQKTGRRDNKVWEGSVNVLQGVMMSSVFFGIGLVEDKERLEVKHRGKKMATTRLRGL